MNHKETHWLARPRNIKRLWIGFITLLALTVIPDFFLHRHGHFGIDNYIGFLAFYGFTTCTTMVILAKVLGFLLKRKDTYYDD